MSFFTLTNTWEEWTWGVLDTRNILKVLCSLASQWFVDGLARFVLFCTDSSTCPYLSPIIFLDVDLGPMTLTHICGGRRGNAFSPREQSRRVWFSGRQWKLPASAMAAFWPPRWSITWIRIDPLLIYKMVGTGYRKVTTCYLMIPGWQALQSWKLTPTLVVCSLYFDTNLHSQLAFPINSFGTSVVEQCMSHWFSWFPICFRRLRRQDAALRWTLICRTGALRHTELEIFVRTWNCDEVLSPSEVSRAKPWFPQ